ncbi:MAG: DUF6348 family protein [Candidatus Sumerlaeia bacterium]
MGHTERIAQEIAGCLKTAGHECETRGSMLTITRWGVRVSVTEGGARENPGRVTLTPTITACHPRLPKGFARELAVGLGETEQDAIGSIAFYWMLLFFPTLKFLFDEHPHDCAVVEAPVALARDDSQPYRLIAGPVQMVGFGDGKQQPEQLSQTLLWNSFSDLLLPALSPGVHHVRCYAGSYGEEVSADVFVDGEEWPEGGERLARLAGDFPAPDDENPVHSLKQHLLVRPEDLGAGADRELKAQVAEWAAAVEDGIDASRRQLLPDVLRALFVMARHGADEQAEQEIVRQGTPPAAAAALLTFIPSAAARVILPKTIRFSETYYWANYETRRAAERRYDQTPLFMAALETCSLLAGRQLAGHEITAAASTSAEVGSVLEAAEKELKIDGFRFTSIIHQTTEPVDGEDLDQLMAQFSPPKKPWWKFW